MNLSPRMLKIAYWSSTVLIALMMAFAGYAYLTADIARVGFEKLGFPGYFRVELGIAKILGAIALLAPAPRWVKEFTYAGFAINLISAVIAHAAVDGIGTAGGAIMALVLLIVSRISYGRLQGW